jgi:hypothetical protein
MTLSSELAGGITQRKSLSRSARFAGKVKKSCASVIALVCLASCYQVAIGASRYAPYPAHPKWSDFKRIATPYEFRTLRSIGLCEEGGSARREPWSLRFGFRGGTYSSAYGIWNGNAAYIKQRTGYGFATGDPAVESLGALALARRYGFSAWGCFGG